MQDDLNALARFTAVLDWLLAVEMRHQKGFNFGLVLVTVNNQEVLGQTYGARDATHMLRELARQMRQSMRHSDLVARDGSDFWILVPFASALSVNEKVAALVEVVSENGLDIVDREVHIFTLAEPALLGNIPMKSTDEFLTYLKRNRHSATGKTCISRRLTSAAA